MAITGFVEIVDLIIEGFGDKIEGEFIFKRKAEFEIS